MQEMNIQEISRELKQAQDDNIQIHPITSRFLNFNIADAYEVAHLVHEQRIEEGWAPVGRKIGFTNSKMWPIYGVCEPIWGYMYDQTVIQVTDAQAKCFIGQYAEPKIEPEIVFHFCTTPSIDATASEILECIDWFAIGFEIVQSHFAGWKFQAPDTIADWGLHAALFIGDQISIKQLAHNVIHDLKKFEIALSCNSKLCEVGYGSNVLGSPLQAVLHLVSVLSNQNRAMPIQAGEIVTTGTLTSAFAINAGQVWSASINGISLPKLSIHFEF